MGTIHGCTIGVFPMNQLTVFFGELLFLYTVLTLLNWNAGA